MLIIVESNLDWLRLFQSPLFLATGRASRPVSLVGVRTVVSGSLIYNNLQTYAVDEKQTVFNVDSFVSTVGVL